LRALSQCAVLRLVVVRDGHGFERHSGTELA
jgi:hypothetical protein